MCSCLNDAKVCEICGCKVAYRRFPHGEVLSHLVEHVDFPSPMAVWAPHSRELCLSTRAAHWSLLLRHGILRNAAL